MIIKTYKPTDRVTLSKNFNSREFYCKCGRNHNNLIADELVTKVQKLTDILGADKVIVNSGYRCNQHDKAVGGNGYGQHTKGTAADLVFWRNGKIISTKEVACKAQDLGFTGIGNIDKGYTAIHLDVRTSGKWYGDEAVPGGTSGSVTTDYYKYYNVARPTPVSNPISDLQKILNSKGGKLVVDGIVGAKTLAEAKKYNIVKGDKGELTKWVQSRLADKGYNVGAIDGIAGAKTMSAIADWQKANGLGVGYLGGGDWDVLLK